LASDTSPLTVPPLPPLGALAGMLEDPLPDDAHAARTSVNAQPTAAVEERTSNRMGFM
jgi:hypothetical protein